MTKIVLRLEKDGKYLEKRLTKRMVCALFDLHYMLDRGGIVEHEAKKIIKKIKAIDIDEKNKNKIIKQFHLLKRIGMVDTWDDIILNKFEKEMTEFFKIIEHIDDAIHNNMIGSYKDGKLVWRKKKGSEYNLFGKPKWKHLNK